MTRRIATAKLSTKLVEVVTAPEWVELIPAGPRVEARARDGRWFLNDEPENVVAAFAAGQQKLPVDIEHATEIKGREGEFAGAVGWIEEMEVRDGAIWGRVSWNDDGRWLIEGKSYRYMSPVFSYNTVNNRVIEITSVALTNQPALKLTALFRAGNLSPETKTEEDTMSLKAICKALGLNEDAAEDNILAAISNLKEDRQTALARAEKPPIDKFMPRADYDQVVTDRDEAKTALARIESDARDTEIETLVGQAVKDGKITPATKDYHIASCRMDNGIELFKAFVKAAPKVAADSGLDGKQPGDGGGNSLTDEDKAVCSAMGYSADDFAKMRATEAAT